MRILIFLACFLLPAAAVAEAVQYRLENVGSDIGFTYTLNGSEVRGQMPVRTADLALDFRNVRQSKVTVALDPSRARAGLAFATEAMRGPQLLDTAQHPTITFTTTRFEQTPDGAIVTGQLTVRGVTRPVTLKGRLFRAPGTLDGDFSRLTVKLTGAISRKSFGADGFPKLVGDRIGLDITAALIQR